MSYKFGFYTLLFVTAILAASRILDGVALSSSKPTPAARTETVGTHAPAPPQSTDLTGNPTKTDTMHRIPQEMTDTAVLNSIVALNASEGASVTLDILDLHTRGITEGVADLFDLTEKEVATLNLIVDSADQDLMTEQAKRVVTEVQADGTLVLNVGSFPEVGSHIYDRTVNGFSGILGNEKYLLLTELAGLDLEYEFGHFGAEFLELTIRRLPKDRYSTDPNFSCEIRSEHGNAWGSSKSEGVSLDFLMGPNFKYSHLLNREILQTLPVFDPDSTESQ